MIAATSQYSGPTRSGVAVASAKSSLRVTTRLASPSGAWSLSGTTTVASWGRSDATSWSWGTKRSLMTTTLGTRVLDQVPQHLAPVHGVRRDLGRAQPRDAEPGVERLERVGQHGHDVIARLHADATERIGPVQVRLVELASGQRAPVDILHGDRVGFVLRQTRASRCGSTQSRSSIGRPPSEAPAGRPDVSDRSRQVPSGRGRLRGPAG